LIYGDWRNLKIKTKQNLGVGGSKLITISPVN